MTRFRKLIVIFSLCIIGFSSPIFSTTSTGVFKKHLKAIFIETGSFLGDGIFMAQEAGFLEIHSIELSPHYYQVCCDRFQESPNVHLHLGDSSIVLKKVMAQIDARSTLWLDGHYSAGNTALGKTNTPILEELAILAEHPIKNHTILIDDIRLFGTHMFDYIELDEIVAALMRINPDYVISFEDGYIPNDVLVAEILPDNRRCE